MNKQSRFSITELTPGHPDWQEFVALKQAKLFDCYQVRSVSGENHPENHHLKLAMRFAVEPMERDEKCLAFVMPLKSSTER